MTELTGLTSARRYGEDASTLEFVDKKINEQVRILRLFFIIGLLVLVVSFSLANYLIVRHIVKPNNVQLEDALARKDMERVQAALDREIHFLSTFTHDWASWDDTYAFIHDPTEQYIHSNLVSTTFTGNGLNLIAYYDLQGNVVWQKIIDLGRDREISLPEFPKDGLPPDHPLLAHTGVDSDISGIMCLQNGLMLVASRPIITSDGQGPVAGTLVFGRFLDEKHEQRIVEQTKSDLHILLLSRMNQTLVDASLLHALNRGEPFVFKENPTHIQVYSLVNDYRGKPEIVLEVNVKRLVTSQAQMLFNYVLLSNLIIGILGVFIILLFHKRLIHSLLKIYHLSNVLARSEAHETQPTLISEQVDRLGRNIRQAATENGSKRLRSQVSIAPDQAADLWEVSLWLAREVEQRGKAEASLRNISTRLEILVRNRTMELLDMNRLLQDEIHERQQYEKKLEKYQKRLRAVASEMLAVEERQRRQIAVDLHDRIGQSLSISRMAMDSILELENLEDIRQQVTQVSEILQQTLQDTRTLTFELCPPVLHELGIGPALEWLAEVMEERYGLHVRISCESLTSYTGKPILTLAFRCIRELLMNVVKHAGIDRAMVKVWQVNSHLHLQVKDKGEGFSTTNLELEDEQVGGFGLFSVQERVKNIGGSIKIESAVGRGTCVSLIIPLDPPEDSFRKEE